MNVSEPQSVSALDHSARAGLLLAAVGVGRSYQPNLLTRNTMDQAIISGVTAAAGYGWGTSGQSLLTTIARRFTAGRPDARVLAAVNTTALVGSLAALRKVPWQEHEKGSRALTRLAAGGVAASAGAGLASMAVGYWGRGRYMSAAMVGTAGLVGVGAWLAGRPRQQSPGSEIKPGVFFEDSVKQVKPLPATAIGVAVTGMTFLLARGESALSRGFSHTAAVVVGGTPDEHRTLGRIGATAASYALGWAAVAAASSKLAEGGEGMEPGHAEPPQTPEVTGSPASEVPWRLLSREGRRWLSMALTPDGINAVMKTNDAKQPIRVYASLQEADTPETRAQALLAEIDRTEALKRPVFALFSPTGSGYVNYVACETLEYLTGGNCASAAIQYSVLPSSLSLTKVSTGVQQTRMVLDGINMRLREMAPEDRPRLLLFGESLGSQVSEDVFSGTGTFGPKGAGIDSAIWIGTPAATEWRRELWGTRTITEAPGIGPEDYYLPRSIADWAALPEEDRDRITYLLLQNGDDPIPKFGAEVLWRRPDWLTDEQRPLGAPKGTTWTPVTTFFATFLDMLNALTPTPGVFEEGGHDYRLVLPDAIRTIWKFPATDEQMHRMQWALRVRERAWELHRRWTAAAASGEPEAAKQKVLEQLSTWQGSPADEDTVNRILEVGLQPAPGPDQLVGIDQIGAPRAAAQVV